jgi:hypothetical protein
MTADGGRNIGTQPVPGPRGGQAERADLEEQFQEALEQLQLVNEIFVRTRRYRNLPGASGIFAGALALLGGTYFSMEYGSVVRAPGAFVTTWTVVFVLALSAHVYFSLRNANRRMEPLVSEVALLLAQTIIPVQVAAIVVPLALYHAGDAQHLAGLWLLLYGIGVLSCRPYVDSWIGWFGWSFIVLGSVHLLWLPQHQNEFMTFGFGLTHLVYGVRTSWVETRALTARPVAPQATHQRFLT